LAALILASAPWLIESFTSSEFSWGRPSGAAFCGRKTAVAPAGRIAANVRRPSFIKSRSFASVSDEFTPKSYRQLRPIWLPHAATIALS
jgi:hypothetical protein